MGTVKYLIIINYGTEQFTSKKIYFREKGIIVTFNMFCQQKF